MTRSERIMNTLRDLSGGKAQVSATYDQIQEAAGCARATVAGALEELQNAGRIRIVNRAGRGGITTYELVQPVQGQTELVQGATELVQSEVEVVQPETELVQLYAEVVQPETELVQSCVVTRSQQMQTSLAEMQTSSTFDGNKAATIELVQSGPRARARHDHENDFYDDDEAKAFQKLLALLGEAGLEGRNKTWLAKQLMPKIAELPRIVAICAEVDKQACWKKPAGVKFMKLKAFALGYQDPLPLFADDDQRKTVRDSVRTPTRAQNKRLRNGGKYRLEQVEYTDAQREQESLRAKERLAAISIDERIADLKQRIANAQNKLSRPGASAAYWQHYIDQKQRELQALLAPVEEPKGVQ